VELTVTDAGPGAPTEWLPTAGQPFSRADPARSGKPGAGLGLSLASRVAQMHGGRLQLRNLPDGGFAASLNWRQRQGD
jgi:two-component system osmolarity sensor histidine kinase EnvZ